MFLPTKYFILFIACAITLSSSAQKGQGTIHFKDGTKKVGFFNYGPNLTASTIRVTDKVIYKTNKKDKQSIEYDFDDISYLEHGFGNKKFVYYFKVPEENQNIILDVNLLYEGKVKLYRHSSIISGPMNTYNENVYYVQKNEDFIFRVFPNKFMGPSSKRLLKQYFSDCAKLVELIDREAFEMYVANNPELKKNYSENRLLEIMKYYDSKCSEIE